MQKNIKHQMKTETIVVYRDEGFPALGVLFWECAELGFSYFGGLYWASQWRPAYRVLLYLKVGFSRGFRV